MLSVENVATPATAAMVFVPDKVPPPGLTPAAVLTGGTVYARCVAAPPLILNAPLVLLRAPDVASNRYPVPLLLIHRSLNVATPATAAIVAVPPRVPLPGLTEIDKVTLLV